VPLVSDDHIPCIVLRGYCRLPAWVIISSYFKCQPRCFIGFLARDVTYTSRAYATYDVSVRLSVRLSVTFVHCGHRVQWIPDTFACLDRWMDVFATSKFTDDASPGSSDGMMPGFLVEEGGMEKLVIVAISLIYLPTESLDRKHVTVLFRAYQRCWQWQYNRSCWRVFFSNLGRKCIIFVLHILSEERFVLDRASHILRYASLC